MISSKMYVCVKMQKYKRNARENQDKIGTWLSPIEESSLWRLGKDLEQVEVLSHYDINDDEDEGRNGNDDYDDGDDVWPIFLSWDHNGEFEILGKLMTRTIQWCL